MLTTKTDVMKRVLLAATLISFFAACSDPNSELKREVVMVNPPADEQATAGGDTAAIAALPLKPVKKTIVRKKTIVATPIAERSSVNSGGHRSAVKRTDPVVPEEANTPSSNENTATTGNNNNNTVNTGTNTGNQPAAEIPEVKKEKKGWSNAAKGAVIGGVAGAVGGAVISKNKGKGAVIGAVIGAAGGYVLGRSKDKKDQANNLVLE